MGSFEICPIATTEYFLQWNSSFRWQPLKNQLRKKGERNQKESASNGYIHLMNPACLNKLSILKHQLLSSAFFAKNKREKKEKRLNIATNSNSFWKIYAIFLLCSGMLSERFKYATENANKNMLYACFVYICMYYSYFSMQQRRVKKRKKKNGKQEKGSHIYRRSIPVILRCLPAYHFRILCMRAYVTNVSTCGDRVRWSIKLNMCFIVKKMQIYENP